MSEQTWILFSDPVQVGHGTHDAWMHADSRAIVYSVWFGSECFPGKGVWEYRLTIPDGPDYQVLAFGETLVDDVLAVAEQVLRGQGETQRCD